MRAPVIFLFAALLAGGPEAAVAADDAVGQQVSASAAAAERLAGDLDGRWVLADATGRTLYVLQLTQPPGGGAPQGAWRSGDGRSGVIDRLVEREGRLVIRFSGGKVSLVRRGRSWRGVLRRRGEVRTVVLRR